MYRHLLKLLALLSLTSIAVVAQQPNAPNLGKMVQRRVSFLTNQLGLSADQQQQATTIFTNAMSGMQSFHQQMHSAHEAMQAAVSKGDNAAIDQAAAAIGNLTAQQAAAHARAEMQFVQILSGDQQAKFAQLHEHGPKEMEFRQRFEHQGPPQ